MEQPTADNASAESLPVEEHGVIDDELHCIGCEYVLKGLDASGACPECGTQISLSLRGSELSNASPFWLLRLSQSVNLLLFVGIITFICEGAASLPTRIPLNLVVSQIFIRILVYCWPLGWLATWLLATPEYLVAGKYRHGNLCWTLRILATIGLLCEYGLIPLLRQALVIYFFAALLMPAVNILTYLRLLSLSRRLGDDLLGRHTIIVMVCLVLSDLLLRAAFRLRPAFNISIPYPYATSSLAIALLATGYSIFVLSRYSTQLTTAANASIARYLKDECV